MNLLVGDWSAVQTFFMNQAKPFPSDASLLVPALPSDSVAQLTRLTRDYARLSEGQAGLSSVLGGAFLLLVALVEMAGHGWRFTFLGAFSPVPLLAGLAVTPLPFLWLGARSGLRRWAIQRFGLVEPAPAGGTNAVSRRERLRSVVGRFVVPAFMLLGLVPILLEPLSARFLRAGLLIVLALALHLTFPRLNGRLESMTAVLLFLAPLFLLAGIQMAAGDSLLAYPLIGAIAIALGIRDHRAFRSLKRELETLGGMA